MSAISLWAPLRTVPFHPKNQPKVNSFHPQYLTHNIITVEPLYPNCAGGSLKEGRGKKKHLALLRQKKEPRAQFRSTGREENGACTWVWHALFSDNLATSLGGAEQTLGLTPQWLDYAQTWALQIIVQEYNKPSSVLARTAKYVH